MPYREEKDTPGEPGPHQLDAVIWRALTGVHERLAEGDERARRYPAAVAPFAATVDTEPASFRALQLKSCGYRALPQVGLYASTTDAPGGARTSGSRASCGMNAWIWT